MATNIFERGYFNRKLPIAPDYMLVNSNFEKNLFLNNTGYGANGTVLDKKKKQ
ncbi:hypothetical protein [Peribacillus simplex]|uniref:hypothetical protein n=1 Tax=Peribacillus simplex TaxID=1478 RepID=UPI001626F5AA|nr:hypothetical protein [Peribacillus simplex]